MNSIISLFLLIASVGIFFGYINPTYGAVTNMEDIKKRSIQELIQERDRYSDALNKTREIEHARTGLLERYNHIPLEDRERLEKLLPDHIDSVRLIIDVNNVASRYGMTLKNINLTGTEDVATAPGAIGPREQQYKSIGLRFSVVGTYDEFRSFMKDLERSLRLADATDIRFLARESEYDFSVIISTYRLNISK